ncbi:MAG: hypothetical protein GW808_05480 [Sphingomonadales bacterium]|nr:hypothetical protein [Sphingomonadales bacterium]NCO49536.1 hypothetical protein [Sphingomonadales bacterium]NCP01129.1 hypothetical protein [Sphingomonadales bacterium]NCP28068.1 hypothetical protein [Sphingomonadales bacterium]NCP42819.1 hypothetical protein [Sphingomonadales bacterium]
MGEILEKLLVPLPDIRTMPAVEARLIIAFRLAVVAIKNDYDCAEQLSDRLGGKLAATRILILAETLGFAWPEPFQIGRPCCSQVTPDEIWLVAAIRMAAGGNRPAFDSLTCEMIGDDERERIFNDLRNFVAAYSGSRS